ncbi:MAG: hypothetical protein GY701_18220 [Sulfitobacter sp.]|nr:hypothetical protein [Sulfitobacter sp.]
MNIPNTVAAESDPIREALIDRGLDVQDHHLSRRLDGGGMYLGPQFRIRSCELVYRLTDADELLLVLYRRLESSGSLRNPFADLIWFLQLATQPRFGLARVLGYVSNFSYRHENGLSEERLVRFYQRFFRADWVEYDGGDWLCQDATTLRARLAQVAHLAARL